MSISLEIEKQLDSFLLQMEFKSESRRIGILGASGSGKSMTLQSIAGILTPERGKIVVDGVPYFEKSPKRTTVNKKPQERSVGYLFQNYALFPTMTVEENIMAGVRNRNKEQKKRIAQELLEQFQLDGLGRRFPSELSGGQQQRVALARILAYRPDIILLDEPFSALDSYLKDKMQSELEEMLKDYQGTVILVSHSWDEIYRFSEELFIVSGGKVMESGRTKELFENPITMEGARLTGCKNLSRVEVIGDGTFYAIDWGISFPLSREKVMDFSYVGIRAHDLHIGEEGVKLRVVKKVELPFEYQLILQVQNQDGKELVCSLDKKEGSKLQENDSLLVNFDHLLYLK